MLGINSLKTVEPTAASLHGLALDEVQELPDRKLRLSFGPFICLVDLDRTGSARCVAGSDEWRPGQGPMPTVRMIFEGGQALDFHEPGKTKRISIRLSSSS